MITEVGAEARSFLYKLDGVARYSLEQIHGLALADAGTFAPTKIVSLARQAMFGKQVHCRDRIPDVNKITAGV